MTDRIAQPWGARTPYAAGQRWPDRVDAELTDGMHPEEVQWTQSAAVLHSNGDGIDIASHDGRIVGARPPHRPGQPRAGGPQGSVRLAGEQLTRSADGTAGTRPRRAGRIRLGHRDESDRVENPGAAS